MHNRRQRAAISQAEIRKQCRNYGAFANGYHAYLRRYPRTTTVGILTGKQLQAWLNGWDYAKERDEGYDA